MIKGRGLAVANTDGHMARKTTQDKWVRVTRAEPCPICERPDYCTRTTDGEAVKCMRVESDKPIEKGGWLHRLDEPLPPIPSPKAVEKKRDWMEECRRMYEHPEAREKRRQVAFQLDVSARALKRLRVGIGWDNWNHREFSSWPSRDHTKRCIGYVRRYLDGAKKTNKGGSAGVFYTHAWCQHPGPVFIVEGGSDVAACETHGLNAIGRASNTHGAVWIRKMIQQYAKHKPIIVIGERDAKPERRGGVASCPSDCTGCAWCWPGVFGMKKVAAELACSGLMIPQPYKDMRDLLVKDGIDELRSEVKRIARA